MINRSIVLQILSVHTGFFRKSDNQASFIQRESHALKAICLKGCGIRDVLILYNRFLEGLGLYVSLINWFARVIILMLSFMVEINQWLLMDGFFVLS